MTTTVIVLFDGYADTTDDGQYMTANCSCTLIRTGEINVIVDTMTPWDKDKLTKKLADDHALTPDDIHYVVCTHGHSDHIGNNNLFLNAIHVVGQSVSKHDKYFLTAFEKGYYEISPEVSVIPTPGHTLDSVSLKVKCAQGTYAIVGDLFERQEDLKDDQIWREAGSEDPVLQVQHRNDVLEWADFIIPGHGPMFTNIKDES